MAHICANSRIPVKNAGVGVLVLGTGTGDDVPEDGDKTTKRGVSFRLLNSCWKTR